MRTTTSTECCSPTGSPIPEHSAVGPHFPPFARRRSRTGFDSSWSNGELDPRPVQRPRTGNGVEPARAPSRDEESWESTAGCGNSADHDLARAARSGGVSVLLVRPPVSRRGRCPGSRASCPRNQGRDALDPRVATGRTPFERARVEPGAFHAGGSQALLPPGEGFRVREGRPSAHRPGDFSASAPHPRPLSRGERGECPQPPAA